MPGPRPARDASEVGASELPWCCLKILLPTSALGSDAASVGEFPENVQGGVDAPGEGDGIEALKLASEHVAHGRRHDVGGERPLMLMRQLERHARDHAYFLALALYFDGITFPVTELYKYVALGGPYDWIGETPALRRLADQVLRTVDREKQRELIQRMERLTHEQAYLLFLYNPIKLYAVNKAVEFVPYQM